LVDAGGQNFDGLTSKWYGQTSNTNDASQSTASNQPQIVSGGTVVNLNGRSAIDFNKKGLTSPYGLNESNNSYLYITVQQFKTYTGRGVILQGGRSFVIERGSNTVEGNIGGSNLQFSVNAQEQFIFTGEWDLQTGDYNIYKDGVQENSVNTPPDRDATKMGIGSFQGYDATFATDAYIQEILVYETNDYSNREKIESNINNYFNIY